MPGVKALGAMLLGSGHCTPSPNCLRGRQARSGYLSATSLVPRPTTCLVAGGISYQGPVACKLSLNGTREPCIPVDANAIRGLSVIRWLYIVSLTMILELVFFPAVRS